MTEDPLAADVAEIAVSTRTLVQRAQQLSDKLSETLPVDAVWVAASDPASIFCATLGSTGLERSALEHLGRPSMPQEIQLAGLHRRGPPDLVSTHALPELEHLTSADCLVPTGFREVVGVSLFEPAGSYLGLLTLLFSREPSPSVELRDCLRELAPLVARGLSPMHSLLGAARLVPQASSGVVLLRSGGIYPLPGHEPHPLLVTGSPPVDVAWQALLAGQVYRTFLWPHDSHGTRHARVTALAATDVPGFVLGTLLVTDEADCRGLTPRELEVLGHVVHGYSNQQIARRLAVAPRTVAAHVEHILHKLGVPSRTQAAVLAEREGCYVPPARNARKRVPSPTA